MALETVELRQLLKTDFELFDFDYQFDDTNLKAEIEQAVTDYYFFSEIGVYSPDRFKHIFKRRFLSAIEYYNELHNTTLLSYDPLVNSKMTESLEKLAKTKNTSISSTTDEHTAKVIDDSTTDTVTHSEGENDTTSTNTTNAITDRTTDEDETGLGESSNYPQDTFAGDYRSEANENAVNREQSMHTESDQTTETTGSTTDVSDGTSLSTNQGQTDTTGQNQSDTDQESNTDNEESYEKTIEGLTGHSYQELIRLERENILRIKQMIIEELKPCFLMVYN